jgi:hypothetical protein
MATITEQLEDYRNTRHEAAQHRYSEILLRFDALKPGDIDVLDKAMTELKVDMHQLEHDIHLIQRYRGYLRDSKEAPTNDAKQQARIDADGIRNGTRSLFLALDDGKEKQK